MSRKVREDYRDFKSFLSTPIDMDKSFFCENESNFFKPVHKYIFSYMNYIHEINNEEDYLPKESLCYLNESLSDIIQSVHSFSLGMIKPSELILRSSIENFIRAISSSMKIDLLEERRIYKLFEESEKMDIFSENTDYFNNLKNSYSNLCRSTHSSLEEHRNISSFDEVNQFKKSDMPKYISEINSIIRSYIVLLVKYNPEFYGGIFFDNRKSIHESLNKLDKKFLFLDTK